MTAPRMWLRPPGPPRPVAVCPSCDRIKCPNQRCAQPIVDGEAKRCPACGTDVRIERKDVR